LSAAIPATAQDPSSRLSQSFRCPEEITSNKAKVESLQEFIQTYKAQFPNDTLRDLLLFRYKLLVAHSCIQTLNSMLVAVSPLSIMLRLLGRNFGPSTEAYDSTTKVWTVRYTKDGKPSTISDEDLVFNFYYWKPPPSAEAIARAFIHQNQNFHIIWKFEAPDEVTKARAFFIWFMQLPSAGQTEGSIGLSKISSVGSRAYTVTWMRYVRGVSAAQMDEMTKRWLLSEDGKAMALAVGRIGVDATFEQHFAEAPK